MMNFGMFFLKIVPSASSRDCWSQSATCSRLLLIAVWLVSFHGGVTHAYRESLSAHVKTNGHWWCKIGIYCNILVCVTWLEELSLSRFCYHTYVPPILDLRTPSSESSIKKTHVTVTP